MSEASVGLPVERLVGPSTLTATRVLSFEFPRHMEHELFRACIQCAVGIEQKHSEGALNRYAKTLREMAIKHCYAPDFELPYGTRLDRVSSNLTWPNARVQATEREAGGSPATPC